MAENWKLRNQGRVLPSRSMRVEAQAAPVQVIQPSRLSPVVKAARSAPRHQYVFDALRQLDATPNPQMIEEIRAWIQEVYDMRGGGTLVGLFGHCYLGHPFVDHAIAVVPAMGGSHNILEHYRPTDAVPPLYQPARPLAVSEVYAMIEVYADGQVVPIRQDGSAAM